MKYIIRPFAEIIVKSKPVRKKYLNFLQTNCNLALKRIDNSIKARFIWDRGEVVLPDNLDIFQSNEVKKILSRMPGIDSFIEVKEYEVGDFQSMFTITKDYFLDKIKNKTFVVRVKRSGEHSFKSIDLERYIGGGLLKYGENSKVNLREPEVLINIEIKDNKFYLIQDSFKGIGGYPIGTQDKVISLISGGFDSGVSTFSMMKRGCKVDYLFFNLGGSAHELGVKQVASYLRKNFGSGYRANFITVNFEKIVSELVNNIDHRYRGIILKRLFLMVADKLSIEREYYGIIKGDSLGQVSSQTLKNMFVIDKASSTLVLRPLISENKQDIINLSKKIGTYDFACNMPEYCGVISDRPATGAKLEKVLKEEQRFDFSLLDEAINNLIIQKIDEILIDINSEEENKLEILYLPGENNIIIDIREFEKVKKDPLSLENTTILNIPFTEINSSFKDLDQSKEYLFYCDKGVLSNLHGLYLEEQGFKNIKIYRPIKKDLSCNINY